MTSTAFEVCTPEEDEAFRAIEARQRESEIVRPSQRERFERWFSDQGKWPQSVERSGEGYKLMQAQSAWETWKVACPEGWLMVPSSPTPEMVGAAEEGHMPFGDMGFAIQCAIAHAPRPGDA